MTVWGLEDGLLTALADFVHQIKKRWPIGGKIFIQIVLVQASFCIKRLRSLKFFKNSRP
jgi:hypothetical protein